MKAVNERSTFQKQDSNVLKSKAASVSYLFLEFVREGKLRNKTLACREGAMWLVAGGPVIMVCKKRLGVVGKRERSREH